MNQTTFLNALSRTTTTTTMLHVRAYSSKMLPRSIRGTPRPAQRSEATVATRTRRTGEHKQCAESVGHVHYKMQSKKFDHHKETVAPRADTVEPHSATHEAEQFVKEMELVANARERHRLQQQQRQQEQQQQQQKQWNCVSIDRPQMVDFLTGAFPPTVYNVGKQQQQQQQEQEQLFGGNQFDDEFDELDRSFEELDSSISASDAQFQRAEAHAVQLLNRDSRTRALFGDRLKVESRNCSFSYVGARGNVRSRMEQEMHFSGSKKRNGSCRFEVHFLDQADEYKISNMSVEYDLGAARYMIDASKLRLCASQDSSDNNSSDFVECDFVQKQ